MSAIATSLSAQPALRELNWSRFALLGTGTVVAAVLANTVVYFIGSALVAYDPEFLHLSNASGEIIMTVFPAMLAVPLYAPRV